MSIILELEPELEARLQAKARVEGVSADELLRSLVTDLLGPVTLAEAIQLYAEEKVTQGQAATLAGRSRAEFIEALGQAGVSVFQYSAEEILEEARRV